MSLYNVALGVFFCGPEPKVGLPGREDNVFLSYFFFKSLSSLRNVMVDCTGQKEEEKVAWTFTNNLN